MYKLRSQSTVVPPYQEVFRHPWPTTVVLSLNKCLVVLRHIIEHLGGGGGATKRSIVLVYRMDSIEGLGYGRAKDQKDRQHRGTTIRV